ncbi:MAG: hypothetical protein ACLTCB_05480 [Merdibacter sp.]
MTLPFSTIPFALAAGCVVLTLCADMALLPLLQRLFLHAQEEEQLSRMYTAYGLRLRSRMMGKRDGRQLRRMRHDIINLIQTIAVARERERGRMNANILLQGYVNTLFFALLFSSAVEFSLAACALARSGAAFCSAGCLAAFTATVRRKWKTGASGAGNVSRKTICAAMKPQRPAWRRSARRSKSRSTASPPSAN